jgi:hypothetical protein
MDYVYAVHATESDGSRRHFEHTQDEPLGVGGPLEDHQREATYIVVSIAHSASRGVADVEAVFSFSGTWPEVPFELHRSRERQPERA